VGMIESLLSEAKEHALSKEKVAGGDRLFHEALSVHFGPKDTTALHEVKTKRPSMPSSSTSQILPMSFWQKTKAGGLRCIMLRRKMILNWSRHCSLPVPLCG